MSYVDVPSSWVVTTIGATCQVVGGGTPDTKNAAYWGGDVNWLTPADLAGYSSVRIRCGARTITAAGLSNSGARLLPTGTVLFSSRAPIGHVAIADGEVATNQGFKSVVPPEGISSEYLYWHLRWATPEIKGMGSGTTFSEVSGAVMRQVPLLLPPTEEQRRIVAELERRLSHVDAAEAGLRLVLGKLASLRTSIEEQLLWPAGRCEVELSSVLAQDGLANGKSVPDRTGGFPVLRLTAMRDGRIDIRERKAGAWTREDASRFLVRQGDFFVARGNGSLSLVGRGARMVEQPDEVAYPDTMIRVRLDETKMLPEFLALVWNSRRVRQQIEAVAHTTAGIYKVNQKHLAAIRLPHPGVEEQTSITIEAARRLSVLDAVERDIRGQLKRCAQARRSILNAAFSGQLAAQNPDDEPAAVLLERIRRENETTNGTTGRTRRKKETRK